MSHYAQLDDKNTVVFVIHAQSDGKEEQFTADTQQMWKQTSYNTRGGVHYTDGEPSQDQTKAFRGNYAGVGFTYDEDLDAFIPPKPSEDATLDTETFTWVVPELEDLDG